MRIPCPLCGPRDLREFTIRGAAAPLPAEQAQDFDRANPAGRLEELWHHSLGCRAWLIVERDTATHAVHGARLCG